MKRAWIFALMLVSFIIVPDVVLAEGGWKYVETTTHKGDWGSTTYEATIGGCTGTHKGDGGNIVKASASWSQPQNDLQPGQQVPVATSMSIQSNIPHNFGSEFAIRLFIYNQAGQFVREIMTPENRLGVYLAGKRSDSQQLSGTWEVPQGDKDQFLRAEYGIGFQGCGCNSTFHYRWVSDLSAAAPPLKVRLVAAKKQVTIGENLLITANVISGQPPYRYRWPGKKESNNNKFYLTPSSPGDKNVFVIVTDAGNRSVKAEMWVEATNDAKGYEVRTSGLNVKDSGVRFSGLNGQVEYWDPDIKDWEFATLDTVLNEGAHIKTGAESSCVLSHTDMSTFVLKAESEVVVNTQGGKDTKWDLLWGNIKVNVNKMIKDGSMNIKMNQAVTSIKGTTFIAQETGSASILKVIEGVVQFTNLTDGNKVDVIAGKQVFVSGGKTSDLSDFDVRKELSLWNQTTPPSRPSPAKILIPAADYVRGCDIAPASGAVGHYGHGVILNAAPYTSRPNCAEYRFEVPETQHYRLEIEYAAAEPRPVQVILNGQMVDDAALSVATGCWTPGCQRWTVVGEYRLRAGSNTLLIERGDIFPHIRALRLMPF